MLPISFIRSLCTLQLEEIVIRSLLSTGIFWRRVKLLRNIIDIFFAAADEVDLLLIAFDWDVEDIVNDVSCFAAAFFNEECDGDAFVEK